TELDVGSQARKPTFDAGEELGLSSGLRARELRSGEHRIEARLRRVDLVQRCRVAAVRPEQRSQPGDLALGRGRVALEIFDALLQIGQTRQRLLRHLAGLHVPDSGVNTCGLRCAFQAFETRSTILSHACAPSLKRRALGAGYLPPTTGT